MPCGFEWYSGDLNRMPRTASRVSLGPASLLLLEYAVLRRAILGEYLTPSVRLDSLQPFNRLVYTVEHAFGLFPVVCNDEQDLKYVDDSKGMVVIPRATVRSAHLKTACSFFSTVSLSSFSDS